MEQSCCNTVYAVEFIDGGEWHIACDVDGRPIFANSERNAKAIRKEMLKADKRKTKDETRVTAWSRAVSVERYN